MTDSKAYGEANEEELREYAKTLFTNGLIQEGFIQGVMECRRYYKFEIKKAFEAGFDTNDYLKSKEEASEEYMKSYKENKK